MTSKKSRMISTKLDDESMQDLDFFISKMKKDPKNSKISRSSILKEAILNYISKDQKVSTEKYNHDLVLTRSKILAKDGQRAKSLGSKKKARKLFLLAASKELEALSMMDEPGENSIRGTIIETILLLKEATDYKRLPELPNPSKSNNIEC